MTELDMEFLNKFIPSETVREKILNIEHIFSDREQAAIIWNSPAILKEKHKELMVIAGSTTDDTLRQQIFERLEYDHDTIECIKNNPGGFIYALRVHEEYSSDEKDGIIEIIPEQEGYYCAYDKAYKDGCLKNLAFDILKYQLILEDTAIIRARSYTSPLIEPDEGKQIEEEDCPGASVGEIRFDKQGRILSCSTYELSKERDLLVKTLSNKRFENAFVPFPNPFKTYDHVKVIQSGELCREGATGWISTSDQDWEEEKVRASQEDAYHDWSDAVLFIDYWDEETLTWRNGPTSIHCLERINDDYCNSYTKDHPILIGHDGGDSTWIQAVNVKISDRITTEDVEEVGKEISIYNPFFWRVLGRLFKEYFDPELIANKNRFTRAFEDEGRFLKTFEYDILEYNFYTYEDMNRIIKRLEAGIKKGGRLISQWFEEDNDVEQLLTLAAHLREIMEENPDADYISVLS